MKKVFLPAAIAAGMLFGGCSATDQLGLTESCVITATGNELCGSDANAWCDVTDDLRAGIPELGVGPDRKSQAVCDDVRGY